MKSGTKSMFEYPDFGDKKKLKEQKSLPHCAQLDYNRCSECFETATYLEKQLPRDIMMASTIIRLTREYDFLVEFGFKVNLNKAQKFYYILFYICFL